ncbi:unnamed protein product [Euphydryas editha]|uniref:Uncharacterized protein n=1 Tax=Euphydryas editha TaxID=104508 RepID=A0AAU9TQA6_EUPED|nr:unnamed protein product [Euphydryas editha]
MHSNTDNCKFQVDNSETQPGCSSQEPSHSRTRATSVHLRERSRSRSITLFSARRQGRQAPRASTIEPRRSCNRESAQRSLCIPTPDDDEHEQRLRDELMRDIRRRDRVLDDELEQRPITMTDIRCRDRVLDDELEQRPISRPTHSRYRYWNGELERRSINDYCYSNDELERRSINNNYRDRSRSRHNEFTDCDLAIRRDSRDSVITTPSYRQGVSDTRQKTDCDKFVKEKSQKSSHMINQFLEALKCINRGGNKLNSVNNVTPEFDPINKNQTITDWLAKVDEGAEI